MLRSSCCSGWRGTTRDAGGIPLGIIYNSKRTHDGYRTECSGFVSMAWQYTRQPDTASLPPRNTSGSYAFELDRFDDLVPGDAVNRKTRIKNKDGVVVEELVPDASDLFEIHVLGKAEPVALSKRHDHPRVPHGVAAPPKALRALATRRPQRSRSRRLTCQCRPLGRS